MRPRTLVAVILTLPLLVIQINLGHALDKTDTLQIVQCHPGTLQITAQGISLERLLKEIEDRCRLTVLGLEGRAKELIRYSSQQGEREKEVKRLLSHLGEKNYIFEFGQGRLRRVYVLPKGKEEAPVTKAPSDALPDKERPDPPESVTVVQVVGILEESQAAHLGLKPGDIIVEYDGIPIKAVEELIVETRSRSAGDLIELILVRGGERQQIWVYGGLIGVKIKTVKVPPNVLGR